ncbi:MAG: glycosyltransferase family 39 protein [Chthoniobacterales bacterium]|nr:glycosyltransferase family 39 protein [Chthoniobacterales bacterium]
MGGSADFIQRMVHTLEAGGAAIWVKRALAVLVILGLAAFYLMHEFRGLATSQAMDQAQIGRNLANGEGWRTDLVRPLAVGQLQRAGKDVAKNVWYDTYNAPLPSLVNAVALLPIKAKWKMTPKNVLYAGDMALAALSICFFVASLVVLYFTALRLFDKRLALLGAGLVLVCDTIWEYTLSGLPQLLLLFLFSVTVYLLVRAVQAQEAGGRVGLWLAAAGAGFGLLALAHALTIWIFIAALIFSIFFFRPRGWAAFIVLATFAFVYTPWLVRNYVVCGQPGGLAIYSILDGINHTEAGHMRRIQLDLEGVGLGHFRNKFIANLTSQIGRIMEHLGWSVVAATFFVSLLHVFRRKETGAVRWLVLAMWAGAVLGMSVYGINEEQGVAANQLHLLFIPIMTCFGLAYLLVQWNRLEIELRIARIGFLTLLFLLCGIPMFLAMIVPSAKGGVRWPPYVPPYIAVLNDWMRPEEVTASDMPWAISWYADRRSLWLPETVNAFSEFHDYGVVGAPVKGLYLTPISGSQNTLSDILKGEYKDWAGVILRSVDISKFPLKWATLLGLQNECVFFADTDRQKIPKP